MKLRTTLSMLFTIITNICSLHSMLASDDQALRLPLHPEIAHILRARPEKARLKKERKERDYFASLNDGFHERIQLIAAGQRYGQGNQPVLRSELARAIANRFRTKISLDELRAAPHTLASRYFSTTLSIRRSRGLYDEEIKAEDIDVLGQKFPYLRSLDLSGVRISNDGLAALLRQPFSPHLYHLNVRNHFLPEEMV